MTAFLDAVKHVIPLAAPERILLDFENAATGAFQSSFPTATVMGCNFHLTQSVIGKVQKIGLKADYENDDNLRSAIRCSPALAMVPASDVVEGFLILSGHMLNHEKIPELLSYFKHT
jgi:hypothetical protein